MNANEQRRGLVIAQIDRGEVLVAEGAALLGVPARQTRLLLAAYRQRGIAALAHGNRGKVATNAVDDEARQAVVTLATERYKGFNQVHLTWTWTYDPGSSAGRVNTNTRKIQAGQWDSRDQDVPADDQAKSEGFPWQASWRATTASPLLRKTQTHVAQFSAMHCPGTAELSGYDADNDGGKVTCSH